MEKYVEVYLLKSTGIVVLIPEETTEENVRRSTAMGLSELIEYLGGLRSVQDIRDSMLRIDKIEYKDKYNFTVRYEFHTDWGQTEVEVMFSFSSEPKGRWETRSVDGGSYGEWEEIERIAVLPYSSVEKILGG